MDKLCLIDCSSPTGALAAFENFSSAVDFYEQFSGIQFSYAPHLMSFQSCIKVAKLKRDAVSERGMRFS